MSKKPIPITERFWKYVDKNGTDGCWQWTGCLTGANGYGVLTLPDRGHIYAHRLSFQIHSGPIPDGMMVCHHCDNPRCVRPDHLFLGTAKDNTRDMINKGRARYRSRKEKVIKPKVRQYRKRSEPTTEIGKLVQRYMDRFDMTYAMFAEGVGIPPFTFTRAAVELWRNGKHDPSPKYLIFLIESGHGWAQEWAAECLSLISDNTWHNSGVLEMYERYTGRQWNKSRTADWYRNYYASQSAEDGQGDYGH